MLVEADQYAHDHGLLNFLNNTNGVDLPHSLHDPLLAMPISPNQFAARAAELEQRAATVTDEAIRHGYLELAAELRGLAGEPQPLAAQSDEQIQQLVERIVGSTANKL